MARTDQARSDTAGMEKKAWHIPLLWPGKTAVVLGSGPSLTRRAAAFAVHNAHTIVINDTYKLVPQASLLYAADSAWWNQNPDALNFTGLKASLSHVKGVQYIRNLGVVGFDDRTDGIHTFGNSGSQGIQLAAKAGAAKIVLLGFDMHGGHWHPEHKAPLRKTEPETFAKWIKRFAVLAEALKVRGVEVINCTPGSALNCFPFAQLEDVLAASVQPVTRQHSLSTASV